MRAAVLRTLGAAPRCEEFPEPVVGDGQALVHVHAAALKPVDIQMAAGAHYASHRQLPCIPGTDGVGHLDDGRRVFFGGCRPPFGAMAERAAVPAAFAFPVPDSLSDATAAALPNPAVSAWLSLAYRAKLAPGDNVLILGATGVTGKLAVRIAKLLGAAHVVAAGRDPDTLAALRDHGADATVSLTLPEPDLITAFRRESFQVVLDYLWGRPAEAFFAAIAQGEITAMKSELRYVQAGESAAPAITLPAAVLRSAAVTIMGTAGMPPGNVLFDALQKVMAHAAAGELTIETDSVPLANIASAWQRHHSGRRRAITI